MYTNQIFELTMTLDNEKFYTILDKVISREGYLKENGEEYIDQSLASKGIIVKYRDSQYKKKIKLIINTNVMMDCGEPDPDKLFRKLEKNIGGYFGYKYQMNDFSICGMTITTDINVHSHKNVLEYLKVLKRIGKVKGFSPSVYENIDESSSFCLAGNSNELVCCFMICNR